MNRIDVDAKHLKEQRQRENLDRKLKLCYTKVPHTFGKDYIKFGDNVMLENKSTKTVLANDLWRELMFGTKEFAVTAADNDKRVPFARNVFIIEKVANKENSSSGGYRQPGKRYDREDEKRLHYGESFQLVVNPSLLVDERTNMMQAGLYLQSERQNTNFKSSRSGMQQVCLSYLGDNRTHFKIVPPECAFNPNHISYHRYAGKPVKCDDPIAIMHCLTNLPLSASPNDEFDFDNNLESRFEFEVNCLSASSSNRKQVSRVARSVQNININRSDNQMEDQLDNVQSSSKHSNKSTTWQFLYSSSEADEIDNRNLPKRITKPKELLKKIREIITIRNGDIYGIREISRSFRIMDDSGDGMLDREEIRTGLMDYGVHLDSVQLHALFQMFDRNNDGKVSIDEFLVALRGPLTKRRLKFILLAYDQLDVNHDGQLTKKEIGDFYDTSFHPGVIDGSKTAEEVITEFMSQWETEEADGIITKDEFVHYYKDVSASIDDDDYFELMMRNAWHLSGGEGWCENTTCIRCLVVHTDDAARIVEIKNDFGVSRNDMPAILKRLDQQGVKNIKKVTLAD